MDLFKALSQLFELSQTDAGKKIHFQCFENSNRDC